MHPDYQMRSGHSTTFSGMSYLLYGVTDEENSMRSASAFNTVTMELWTILMIANSTEATMLNCESTPTQKWDTKEDNGMSMKYVL